MCEPHVHVTSVKCEFEFNTIYIHVHCITIQELITVESCSVDSMNKTTLVVIVFSMPLTLYAIFVIFPFNFKTAFYFHPLVHLHLYPADTSTW